MRQLFMECSLEYDQLKIISADAYKSVLYSRIIFIILLWCVNIIYS